MTGHTGGRPGGAVPADAPAAALLRDALEAFRESGETEAILPALWAYAAVARERGATTHEVEAGFLEVFNAVHAARLHDRDVSRRRARLVATLRGSVVPMAGGYLANE